MAGAEAAILQDAVRQFRQSYLASRASRRPWWPLVLLRLSGNFLVKPR